MLGKIQKAVMRQCQVLALGRGSHSARLGGLDGNPRGAVETQCSRGSLQSEISCRDMRPRYRKDSVRYRRLVTDERPVERRLGS